MGVAIPLRRSQWSACGAEASRPMGGGGGEDEGVDMSSLASATSLDCEGWLLGMTGSPSRGAVVGLDAGRSLRAELGALDDRIWSWDNGRSVWFVLTLYMATLRRNRSASAIYLLSAFL